MQAPGTAPTPAPLDLRHPLLTAIAALPVLATVYQTLVLTDVTGDVIRKGIEGDSYQMLWTNLTWGIATLYGLFLGIWALPRYGARLSISAGLVLFALGNLLCGVSVDVPSMAASRMVEGIGKGMTISLFRSALYRQFDLFLIAAIGFYGVAAYATRHLTPLVTGELNDTLTWRWIYWYNVPVAALGLVLVRRTFRPDRPEKPVLLRIDWVAVTILAAWVASVLFAFGWYRRWGGLTSNRFSLTAVLCVILPIALLSWMLLGLSPDDHLKRLLRVRGYVLAMCVRMLLLVNLAEVVAVMGQYLTELQDYPREVAGMVLAPAAATMAISTLLTTLFHRRRLRALWLLVGVVGSSACLWWLSGIDYFTAKGPIAASLACWGFFLGFFPPVFLTDEVEAIERKDTIYGASLSMVFLILPLLIVPIATGTAIKVWIDRAVDSQRLKLREERTAVREARARLAEDYRQRGVDGPELSSLTASTLGGSVKVESVARGFQDGLKFFSLTILGIGLPLGVFRCFLAPSQVLVPEAPEILNKSTRAIRTEMTERNGCPSSTRSVRH